MKRLLHSPSVVAIGIDPVKGEAHFMVKTPAGEARKVVKLSPEHKMMFDMACGYVETYL